MASLRRLGRPRRARPRLRTGFHLPRFAATAARGVRRRAAPGPAAAGGAAYPGAGQRHGAGRHRPGRCRCRMRRWTSCTRGGPTSSARAASRACASSTASCAAAARRSSSTTTPTRSTFGRWFRRGLPDGRPGRRRALLGRPGLDPRCRSTSTGASTPAPTSRPSCASSSPPRSPTTILAEHAGTDGRLRGQPLVAALLSRASWPFLMLWGCKAGRVSNRVRGAARTHPDDSRTARVGESSTPGPATGGVESRPSSALTISTATCSSGWRTEVSPAGTTWATWESSKPTTATSRPQCDAAVAEGVQHAHRQRVGGADERRRLRLVEQHRRGLAAATPRCPRPATPGRWSAGRARAWHGSSPSAGPRR